MTNGTLPLVVEQPCKKWILMMMMMMMIGPTNTDLAFAIVGMQNLNQRPSWLLRDSV